MNLPPDEPRETKEPKVRRERKPMTTIARRLRHGMTPAEARLWAVVRRRQCGGLRFLRQHDLGHHVVDFYCATANVAIELEGAIHDRPDVAAHDRERQAFLESQFGVRFVRLPNAFVLSAGDTELQAFCSGPSSRRTMGNEVLYDVLMI